jgi:hypothetical protein
VCGFTKPDEQLITADSSTELMKADLQPELISANLDLELMTVERMSRGNCQGVQMLDHRYINLPELEVSCFKGLCHD